MTYATTSDRYTGEKPLVFIKVDNTGGSALYWSTQDVADENSGIFYDGRIVDPGTIDRAMVRGRIPGGDLVIRVSNADGALDHLFTGWSASSALRGDFTVTRGFESLGVTYQTEAKFQHARLIGIDGERVATIELSSRIDAHIGTIEPPTVGAVMDALAVVDGTLWGESAGGGADGWFALEPGVRRKTVPVCHGSWGAPGSNASLRTGDGVLTSGRVFSHIGSVGGVDNTGVLQIVCVSKYQHSVSTLELTQLNEDGARLGATKAFTSKSATGMTWASIAITLDGDAWRVFLIKGYKDSTIIGQSSATRRHRYNDEPFSLAPPMLCSVQMYSPSSPSAAAEYTVADLARATVEAGDEGPTWSGVADTASWSTVDERLSGVRMRSEIREPVNAVLAAAAQAAEAGVDVYATKAGAFAGYVGPVAVGGPSPDYTSKLLLTEEDDILAGTARLSLPEDGDRHGLANLVTVRFTDSESGQRGPTILYDPLTHSRRTFWSVQGSVGKVVSEDATSRSTTHDRDVALTIDAPGVYTGHSAKFIADREIALRGGAPRATLHCALPIRGTQLELGDIVRVTHTMPPGWSAARLCAVESYADDLAEHVVHVALVDYDDELNAKRGYYDDQDNWDSMTGAAGETISLTATSDQVSYSFTTYDENDIEQYDILSVRGWIGATAAGASENAFNFFIVSIDTGANTFDLEDSASFTESNITAWRLYKSQDTRANTGADYTARADKYAAHADDVDDLFRDDSTAPYVME